MFFLAVRSNSCGAGSAADRETAKSGKTSRVCHWVKMNRFGFMVGMDNDCQPPAPCDAGLLCFLDLDRFEDMVNRLFCCRISVQVRGKHDFQQLSAIGGAKEA